jgi:hypothetical protein
MKPVKFLNQGPPMAAYGSKWTKNQGDHRCLIPRFPFGLGVRRRRRGPKQHPNKGPKKYLHPGIIPTGRLFGVSLFIANEMGWLGLHQKGGALFAVDVDFLFLRWKKTVIF